MPGKRQIKSTASIIKSTKGSVPQMMSDREMSGAIFLITKMFSPTGGWINPISMTTVITTPNQMRSNPAALRGGRMIGAVIRMIETGGRKKPRTTTSRRIASSRTHFDRPRLMIHAAVPCEICR